MLEKTECQKPDKTKLSEKAVLAMLSLLTAMLAWPAIFSTFAIYDDEGCIMMTLQTYLQGHRLYGDTFTPYGPAFYLITAPLHSVLHLPLTQTGIRIKTLLFWAIAVLLCYAIVKRTSKSTSAGVIAGLLAALHLDKLALEPGHPQEIALLGTLGILTLVARWKDISTNARAMNPSLAAWLAIGFLAGLVGLVKMNCGVVVAVPLVLTAAVQLPWARRLRWGFIAVAVVPSLMVAMGARIDLTATLWAIWIGICATVFVYHAIPSEHRSTFPAISPLLGIVAGALISIALILGISLGQGISIDELWLGLVGQHSYFVKDFFMPISLPIPVLVVLALTIAAILCRTSSNLRDVSKQLICIGVTLAIGVTAMLPLRHGLEPRGAGLLLAWAAPGWIVWLWRRDVEASPKKLALGLVAIISPLIAFPVSGTQIAIGTLPSLLVVGIFLGEYFVEASKRFSLVDAVASGTTRIMTKPQLLGCIFVLLVVSSSAHWIRYVEGTPLCLPGSAGIRLPSERVSELRSVVAAIEECHATNLMFEGSIQYCFYFWTGLSPLTAANPAYWPLMLREAQQTQLSEAIDRCSRLCIVRVPDYDRLYKGRAKAIREKIEDRWQDSASIGEWQIGIVD